MATTAVKPGTFVLIRGGKFRMGRDGGRREERPVRDVTITRPFWMMKHAVTNEEYRKYLQAAGRPVFGTHADVSLSDHPAVNVRWFDADAYGKWLSGHVEGCSFRLPTEAEREFAARGPQSWAFPWGNEWDPARAVCSVNRERRTKPEPVGSIPAGATKWEEGTELLDMAGNVWEWCADWYDAYNPKELNDPQGPGIGTYRVLRGNFWGCADPDGLNGAFRGSFSPFQKAPVIGFRLVMSGTMTL